MFLRTDQSCGRSFIHETILYGHTEEARVMSTMPTPATKTPAYYSYSYYQGGGFPITKEGRLKFGFRGRKFTNFCDHPSEPNLRVSTPRTRYTDNPINTVPLYGLKLMKEVIGQAFPELAEIGFTDSRLCWYTDTSGDRDGMVIDYVPGYADSLFLCTGHGFKFLPNLGKHVKNQLERVPDQFTNSWKWRVAEDGADANGLLQGQDGPREMSKIQMAEGTWIVLPPNICC
jgi:sarcosine oxidase/L-pipecolate oxidase